MSLPLKSFAKLAAGLGFQLGGEIVRNGCTYSQTADAAYNPSTGQLAPVLDTRTVKAMVLQYSERERANQGIKTGDEKVIIQAAELGTLQPSEDDTLTEASPSTIKRQVIGWIKDPTATFYIFQMRQIEAVAVSTVAALTYNSGDGFLHWSVTGTDPDLWHIQFSPHGLNTWSNVDDVPGADRVYNASLEPGDYSIVPLVDAQPGRRSNIVTSP